MFLSENVRRCKQVYLSENIQKVADRCFLVKMLEGSRQVFRSENVRR